MFVASPLRYPGGKASLAGFLERVIDLNELRNCRYYEPYAGGAGAALSLLRDNVVSEIWINDADHRIYSFWHAALNETFRFVDKIMSIDLSIKEWHAQRAICEKPAGHSVFDIGFATFYMNRCNRSGVIAGAGPIGGYAQSGKWTLDVRFSREGLTERLLTLSRLRNRIQLHNLDAIGFLKQHLPRGSERGNVFAYLDPPYVNKARRLYLNAYEAKDHTDIAQYLNRQQQLSWLLSYDDTPLVQGLYADQQVQAMPLKYSLQKKRSARELIIAPLHLALPSRT
jgi:DNA adenine methylase